MRKSCGQCHFTNTKRPSDITIADFWGWEKTDPNINADNKGVSLVLLNTEKGRKLFEAVKKNMITIPADLDNCTQPNLQHPTKMDSKCKNFEHDYQRHGFEYVLKKYNEDSIHNKFEQIKGKIIRTLKSVVKFIIRKQ